jgi:hypothetical protein
MPLALASVVDNFTAALAASYAAGSGTLALAPGSGAILAGKLAALGYPSVSPAAPLRITVVTQATYRSAAEVVTIFSVTGRSGDVLTGATAIEGTADRNYAAGDRAECRWTAGGVQEIQAALALAAPLASPALTGTPTAPTATVGTNTTQLATTAFVIANAGAGGAVSSVAGRTGAVTLAEADVANLTGDLATLTTAVGARLLAAANLSDVASASSARTNLGLGSAAVASAGTFLQVTNNLGDLASAATARTNLGLAIGTNVLAPAGSGASLTGITAAQVGAMSALTPTAAKTSAYTASAGDFVPVDTTGGAVTITLPAAPADRTLIEVKHVIQGGTNAVTVACGGSDVFNRAGGATSFTLPTLAQGALLQYKSSAALWYVLADDLALSQLDARFATAAQGTLAASAVQSITLTTPGVIFTTPVTFTVTAGAASGALALATQAANTVLAGPTTGGNATPTMRVLVAADVPNLDAAKVTTGTLATARLGSGTASATTYLRGDQTWATVAAGGSPPFAGGTGNPLVKDATDATKLAAFDASSIATGTTRTYTLPNVSGTLALNGSTAAPLSAPGAGTSSERYGAGATATGNSSTALGPGATATGNGATTVGSSAAAAFGVGVAIGYNSTAGNSAQNVVIGGQATASNSITSASIALGYLAAATANATMVVGSTTAPINEAIFAASSGGFTLTGQAQSSTAVLRNAGRVVATLPTGTDASRKGRLAGLACDAAGTDREGWRVESDGTQPLVSFYGVAAVARAAAIADADGTLADLTTKYNLLKNAIKALGLTS